jgi:hypothetical protein
MKNQEIIQCELIDGRTLAVFLDEDALISTLIAEALDDLSIPKDTLCDWHIRLKPATIRPSDDADPQALQILNYGNRLTCRLLPRLSNHVNTTTDQGWLDPEDRVMPYVAVPGATLQLLQSSLSVPLVFRSIPSIPDGLLLHLPITKDSLPRDFLSQLRASISLPRTDEAGSPYDYSLSLVTSVHLNDTEEGKCLSRHRHASQTHPTQHHPSRDDYKAR